MQNHQQDGAAAPGPDAAENGAPDAIAPLGAGVPLPDVAVPSGEAPAGHAAQDAKEQTTADAAAASGHGGTDRERHPLSAAWGDMPDDEFADLVADIKKNGLVNTIVQANDGTILDGWHRYRACIEAGVKPRFDRFEYVVETAAEDAGRTMTEAQFACAQNAHRRHLTAAQSRVVVKALLKARPGMSNRSIAKAAKVDDKTVGTARARLVAGAEIPHQDKTTGLDGKTYTKVKQKPKTPRTTTQHPVMADDRIADTDSSELTTDESPDLRAESAVPSEPPTPPEQGVNEAPAMEPPGRGYVQVADLTDRKRVVDALKTGGKAVQSLAREVGKGSIARSTIEQTIAVSKAAIAELENLLASAEARQ